MAPVARHATATTIGRQTFRSVYDVEMAAQRLAYQPPADGGAEAQGRWKATNVIKWPRFSRSGCIGMFGGWHMMA
jgi:hypothetical protein